MAVVIETDSWAPRAILTRGGYVVRGPDRPYVEAMLPERGFDRLLLATRALRKNPDCIEANLEIACANDDPARRLHFLEKAVQAGDLLWARIASFAGADGLWNPEPATRPWLEAIKILGVTLGHVGDHDRQRECFERLAVLDPTNELGAADHLEAMPQVYAPRFA
jgi:hypothetical protein